MTIGELKQECAKNDGCGRCEFDSYCQAFRRKHGSYIPENVEPENFNMEEVIILR